MQYFIKEQQDGSASIYAEDGHRLETFATLKDAIRVCREECLVEPMWVESPFFVTRRSYLNNSPQYFQRRLVDAA